jgi:hypothetical protein
MFAVATRAALGNESSIGKDIMRKPSPTLLLMLVLGVFGPAAGRAAEGDKMRSGHSHNPGAADPPSCRLSIQVTDKAERQAGGALYRGSAVPHHMKSGQPMPAMAGAHMDHTPRHGGAFFMAPNKMNHLEAVYSEQCGFRLAFYNAFTKPIRADRFRAFIHVVPAETHEPEVLRFLSPNEEGTLLQAAIGEKVTRPFDVELYVEFPGSDDPELFTVKVSK